MHSRERSSMARGHFLPHSEVEFDITGDSARTRKASTPQASPRRNDRRVLARFRQQTLDDVP